MTANNPMVTQLESRLFLNYETLFLPDDARTLGASKSKKQPALFTFAIKLTTSIALKLVANRKTSNYIP
jgi:hypothetical protein